MNIKNLTKIYLNTLPGLSEQEKEKIANFNANSDRIVLSAVSLPPVVQDVTEYHNPDTGNLDRFSKDYGGFKKVDEDGYILIDESEYNPFYPQPVNIRKLPLERRILDRVNYKRDANGFLKARKTGKRYSEIDKAKGEEDGWERFQHLRIIDNIPLGINEGVKTTRTGVYFGLETPLANLLEGVWNEVVGSEDGHDVGRINFPVGAGVIDTPSYLNKSHYCVLPNDKTARDKLWVTITKKSFEHQTEWLYSLSFDLEDIRGKQTFKLYPDLASLMNKVTNTNTGETNDPNPNTNNPPNNATNELNDYNLKVRQYNQQIN